MQEFTRRAALAAVPALAMLPTMVQNAEPAAGAISPHIAELASEYWSARNEWERLTDRCAAEHRDPSEDEDRLWWRKSELADRLTDARAETIGDLVTQTDVWLDYYVEKNLDGTPGHICDMGGPEMRFPVHLPETLRRLAGAA